MRTKQHSASEAYRHSADATTAAQDSLSTVNRLVAKAGAAERQQLGRITEVATDASLDALGAVRRPVGASKQLKVGS